MAVRDQGVTREVVNDPLALTGREQLPDRSLALQGIRPPNVGDPTGAYAKQANGLLSAMDGLTKAFTDVIDKKKDELITEGKTAYLSGKTEAEMAATGNRYTQEGYNTLAARDKVNTWFAQEAVNIDEAGKKLSPQEYQEFLSKKRKEVLDTITDPAARKVAVAAFEEMSPRLAQSQTAKASNYQKEQRVQVFSSALGSTAQTSATRSVQTGNAPLSLTPEPIAPIVQSSAKDRDIGIRTILGEAANQGSEGMAAVAHVLRNRAGDSKSRWPNSVAGVALQPQQFSIWNDGEGGWSGRSVKPGDALYEKAGAIYDAVMGGRHVDPTGGATHYYSPEGMRAQGKEKPDWFDEVAKTGGSVTIGGHVFAGRTAKGFSGDGKLNFVHQGQDKLQPTFRSILTDVSAGMGRELTIQSGHRDASHPVEARKATPGEHSNGSAADIDMTGMNDAERQALVRQLRARGVMRFGTYSNMPNTLHIDMKDQNKDGTTWFMHDRTNGKIGNAPAWFKQASAEDPRTITSQPKQSGTEVQNFIRGYAGLDGPDKAAAVADAMRRRLEADDDSLYTDAGGLSILWDLQAKPSDIDEVVKAKKRFDDRRTNKFSAENEAFRDDILKRAEKGESRDSIFADIDARVKSRQLDDQHARSLAQTAADKIRAQKAGGGESQLTNVNMLSEIGGLYQKINTGAVGFEDAANEAKSIAAKYGANEQDVKSIVGQVFQLDQSYKNGLRAEADKVLKEKAKRDITVGEVQRSLSRGYGLGQVSGEKLEITNDAGQKVKVSAQEYGVQMVKDKWAKQYSDAVNEGKLSVGVAKPELIRKVFLELQNHDVVDEKTQAQMKGALSGNIIEKDGTLKKSAVEAYETFLTWKQTQNAKPGYIKRQVGDDEVFGLLEQAYTLDAGDLSKEQALIKAHEILKDPNRDPEDTLKKDAVWRTKMETDVKKALKEKVQAGFWEGLVYDDSGADVERITRQNNLAERYVIQRAEAYHAQYPNEHAEVSLSKAVADLTNHSRVVAGNLIISKPGYEIDKAMGVEGFGPKAADEAVQKFLAANGEKLWPGQYGNPLVGVFTNKKGESYAGALGRGLTSMTPSVLPPVAPRNTPVRVDYNADMGTITIDLYKDEKKGETLGSPKVFFVKDIGAAYAKEQTTPSTASKLFNSMFESLGAGLKTMRENSKPPAGGAALGAEVGKMIADTAKQ